MRDYIFYKYVFNRIFYKMDCAVETHTHKHTLVTRLQVMSQCKAQ